MAIHILSTAMETMPNLEVLDLKNVYYMDDSRAMYTEEEPNHAKLIDNNSINKLYEAQIPLLKRSPLFTHPKPPPHSIPNPLRLISFKRLRSLDLSENVHESGPLQALPV